MLEALLLLVTNVWENEKAASSRALLNAGDDGIAPRPPLPKC